MPVQLISDSPKSLQRHQGGSVVGRDRHGKAVDHNVLPWNAVSVRRLIDPAGDADPALRVGGNPVFVEDQRHKDAAVLPYKRKNCLDALFFAVDRVDHRLSVIDAHAPLKRGRIRGVDLQRQREHALKLLNNFRQHLRLIDLGKSDVHIEDMGAAVLLPKSLSEDILDIIVPKGLLEFLLAGGIDALSDDHGLSADLNTLGK